MQACPECGAGRAPLLPLGGIFWCSAVTEVDSQHQAGSSWLAPAAVCRITSPSHNSRCHSTSFVSLHSQWLPKQQPAKRAAREALPATRSVKTSFRLWYVLTAPLSTASSCLASDGMARSADEVILVCLQIIADSFQDRFKPFTLEKPRVR